MGYAFHQAPIAGDHPGAMIDNLMSGLIELLRQFAFSQGHPHSGGQPLAQRSGSCLHARALPVFRVAGSFRVQLAEIFDVVNAHVIAGQVQQAIQQH